MCKLLKVSRANVYRYQKNKHAVDPQTERILRIFRDSQQTYGTRRLKAACKQEGVIISRRRITRIMKENGLVSVYTKAQFKVHKSGCNEADTENVLNRQYDSQSLLNTIVSDLTYVRVNGKWNYICILIDLHNREIIGYGCGKNKDTALVMEAFASVKIPLYKISLFHTDRGREFVNQTLEALLDNFGIQRSLSHKGTPYDNAVAEATFKSIKFEFVYPKTFNTIEQLKQAFSSYVWWFNNKRLHSSLGYLPPIKFKELSL